jgi:dihydrofolate reductase
MHNFILASSKEGVIGYNGHLPWNLPEEYQYFLDNIKDADAIVMARDTFRALGEKPIKDCPHFILTHSPKSNTNNVLFISSLSSLNFLSTQNIWYIGGRSIYESIDIIQPDRVYITKVKVDIPMGDKVICLSTSFFDSLYRDYTLTDSHESTILDRDTDEKVECQFMIWDKKV